MTRLRLASSNIGKFKEFQSLLLPTFEVEPLDSTPLSIVEDGNTYQENALKKAEAYSKVYSSVILSDDSGLEIDVLQGGPGVLSARFGGEAITWEKRFQVLYEALRPYSPDSWTARFRCVLCLYLKKDPPLFFEGVCEGKILTEPRGSSGFGYDPIFFSSDLQKTFGEAHEKEKSLISHRARAYFALKEWAQKNLYKLT